MTDDTRRDIPLGDLSAIETAEPTRRQPRIGDAGAADGKTRPARIPAFPVRETGDRTEPRFAALPLAGSSSWPVVALTVSVLLLAGLVIYLLYRQSTTETALAALEANARASVQTLESRVASTNTTLRSTDSETQRSLNLVGEDIRRLNDGINRLAKALRDEVAAREALGKDLATLAGQMRENTLAAQKTATDQQRALDVRLKSLADAVEAAAARQKSMADSLARLERQSEAAQLRSEIAVLGASVRQLQEDHERRLRSAEQSAASNDAFRRQVNATIDRLIQQVNELYARR